MFFKVVVESRNLVLVAPKRSERESARGTVAIGIKPKPKPITYNGQ